KEYRSKLIIFPRKLSKPKQGDSEASELEMVKQVKDVLPITPMTMPIKARQITEDERNASVFTTMRFARANKRLIGIRAKRVKDKAEADMLKKK
uniref:ribosomal protein L13e n=1 Tax=Salmonella sp. s51933 TaxID=3160127 RepID=UPI0037545E06